MIRVLVVDDSALVRKTLTEALSHYDDIEVVGSAVDPFVARDRILSLKPDVITLDLEMPRMDGLSFLARLMKYRPTPVVVVSSLTPPNSKTALTALELGAIAVISKPGSAFTTPIVSQQLVQAIRAAAASRLGHWLSTREQSPARTLSAPLDFQMTHKIIAVGASAGGTRAIEHLLSSLPRTSPGVVITQHMPTGFTAPLAERLNTVCALEVREAKDNDQLVPGLALIAPGGRHMLLTRSGATYSVKIKDGPHVHYSKPSVDVLLQSVAASAGSNAVGVLLTGMGRDGAKGLLAMRERGAHTVAEAEETCLVFGMPRAAIDLGAAVEVLPLPEIASAVLRALSEALAV